MGPMFIHLNPDIYPDPHQFIPERWMGADKGKLDQYLVTFGRGSRACLGMKWVIQFPVARWRLLTRLPRVVWGGVSCTSSSGICFGGLSLTCTTRRTFIVHSPAALDRS